MIKGSNGESSSFILYIPCLYLTAIFIVALQIDSDFNASGIDVTSGFHTVCCLEIWNNVLNPP